MLLICVWTKELREFSWCKNLPVIYTDNKNKGYCVFHAPVGKKGISKQDFFELVLQKISKSKSEICDLSGTIFEIFHPLEITVPSSISFFMAKFSDVSFNGATFMGDADFRMTTFCGIASFRNSKFMKKADFSESIFLEEADFAKVSFNDAQFVGSKEGLQLLSAFMYCKGNIPQFSLRRRLFIQGGNFTDLTIMGSVRFENATLEKISFMNTDLRKIDFTGCDWHKKRGRGRDILYDEVKTFEEIKKERKERGLIHWLKHVSLPEFRAACKDREMLPGITRVIGRHIRRLKERFRGNLWESIRRELNCLMDYFFLENIEIKKVETLYCNLKQKYKEKHNEPEVSKWHYCEKDMYRRGSRFRRFFGLSFLYWLSSGYGERPVRSGIALFVLLIGISVLFGLTGIKPTEDNGSVIKIKEWADIWNLDYFKTTIECATFESKPAFTPVNWFLKVAAKLFIPLQAALFAFAARNRFRR